MNEISGLKIPHPVKVGFNRFFGGGGGGEFRPIRGIRSRDRFGAGVFPRRRRVYYDAGEPGSNHDEGMRQLFTLRGKGRNAILYTGVGTIQDLMC